MIIVKTWSKKWNRFSESRYKNWDSEKAIAHAWASGTEAIVEKDGETLVHWTDADRRLIGNTAVAERISEMV